MMINRMIVHEDVYDEFTEKLVARSKEIKHGDPRDPDVVVGPFINGRQLEKSLDNIEKAKEAGFDILLEGEHAGNILTLLLLVMWIIRANWPKMNCSP